MADESSTEIGRAIEAHAKAMTLLSREVGVKVDVAASKLDQQARMLKILVWLIAIEVGFGLIVTVIGGAMGIMGFMGFMDMTTRTRGIGSQSGGAAMVGKPLPGFSLEGADGARYTNHEIEGKVVLLNFWATWCGPCRTEMPWFVEFQNRYQDRGFTVLAVSMDEEGWEVVRPFVKEQGLNFPVFVGGDDFAGAFGGVNVLPTTLIVDRTGKIVARHRGLIDKSEYEEEIEALLLSGE